MVFSFTSHCYVLLTVLFLYALFKSFHTQKINNKLVNLFLKSPCLWGHGACDFSSVDPFDLAQEVPEEDSGITYGH